MTSHCSTPGIGTNFLSSQFSICGGTASTQLMRTCIQTAELVKVGSLGITSVSDASANPAKINLCLNALDAGQSVRVNMMVRQYRSGSTKGQFTDLEGDRWGPSPILRDLRQLGIRTGVGNDQLKIGPVKIVHGNSLSGRTCCLYDPYADRPNYYGIPPGRSQEALDELILHRGGEGNCRIGSNENHRDVSHRRRSGSGR